MTISQETQIRRSEVYDADLDNTQAETAPVSLQDDINMLRTLFRKVIDPTGNWFDNPPIDLTAIASDPTPADFVAHAADTAIHFQQTDIDHVNLLSKGVNTHEQIDIHIADLLNPHGVTPGQIGAAALAHLHVATDVSDFTPAVDAQIAVNALVAANTAKVSAAGSIDTHSDVRTSGANLPVAGDILFWDGAHWRPATPGAGGSSSVGDVSGPGLSAATDTAVARWDTASGQLLDNSSVLLSDPAGGITTIKGGLGITLALQSDAGRPLELRNATDSVVALSVEAGASGRVVVSPHGDVVLSPGSGAVEIRPGTTKATRIYHGDSSEALAFADAAGGHTVLFDTMRPATSNLVALGDVDAGGRWADILTEKLTLEEGSFGPAPVTGMTQLYMSALNHVTAIKSNGVVVDLELGGGGGSGLQFAYQTYVPTPAQTVFILSQAPVGKTLVFINGVQNTDFVVVGTQLTWSPVAAGFSLTPDDDFDVYYEV